MHDSVFLPHFCEPEILCNNGGVDLIEAYADVDLSELNLYNPNDNVEVKLVPQNKGGNILRI
jgi:Transferase family